MATTENRCMDCGWEGVNMGRVHTCPKCKSKHVDNLWDEEYDFPLTGDPGDEQE